MNTDLTVHFVGICTHVWWMPFTSRVVLVNATSGATINNQTIWPHFPTLRIAAADILDMDAGLPGASDPIVEWTLTGARIAIENAAGVVEKHSSFDSCVPHLGALSSDLGPPSSAVVNPGNPLRTSAIFEITGGMLHGGVNEHGASVSYLTVPTNGESPRLRLTSFGFDESRVIALRAGAEITLSNISDHDDLFDFYLHFETAEEMPPNMRTPDPMPPGCSIQKPARTWPPGAGSVGPGCSNSTYP